MASVLWFQGGACSGNTMSFLNADEPNVVDLIVDFGLDLVWHPSLGLELGKNAQKVFWDCAKGERPLDIFVFEGSVMEAYDGRTDMFADRPMKDWVTDLAAAAPVGRADARRRPVTDTQSVSTGRSGGGRCVCVRGGQGESCCPMTFWGGRVATGP